jgi:hypothetical protein
LGRAVVGPSRRMAGLRRRQQLKALGNSVCPAVAEEIGRAILKAEEDLACDTSESAPPMATAICTGS